MREPLIRGRTVPVVDIRGDLHHISGQQPARGFAPFLIEAGSADRDQQLPAGMPVPVVPAARLEGNVRNRRIESLVIRQRSKIRLAAEIFCVCRL